MRELSAKRNLAALKCIGYGSKMTGHGLRSLALVGTR